MKRHQTFLTLYLVFTAFLVYGQEKPNIVWITTEDNSAIWLKLYDKENGVSMPNVEALADHGLVFDHAFSNGAVCSVARSTLISGVYAPRSGSQFHRNAFEVPLPEGLKSYPEYLKEAGYYTANRHKEDYNFKLEGIWDDSSKDASYRNRKEGQPFMQVWSLHDTHEVECMHRWMLMMKPTCIETRKVLRFFRIIPTLPLLEKATPIITKSTGMMING